MDNCVRIIDKHIGNDVDRMIGEIPNEVRLKITKNAVFLKSFVMSIIMQLFLREKITLKEKTNGKD